MLVLYRKPKKGFHSIENLFNCFNKKHKTFYLSSNLNSIYSFFKILFELLKIKEKNIHITGDVNFVSFMLFWKKTILTIHDLNYYESLNGFKKFLYGLIWFRLPLYTSNIVTVISPYTKKQILYHFKINEKKLIVINNHFNKIPKIKTSKSKFFTILAIGSSENKNISRLVDAISTINNIKLIIVGNPNKSIISKIELLEINYKQFFNIERSQLHILYNQADLLFFASTKEGFGLPILEAQSCGIPVITSNTTAMPFVAGDGAEIVDPYSINEISDAINKIKKNKSYRKEIISNGYKNIKRFTTENFISKFENQYFMLNKK